MSNESLKLELLEGWEPRTVNSLKNVIKVEAPKIVFLMETKSCKGWMEEVCDEYGFKNRLIVPSDGFSGGLTLLWKKEVTIHVQTYSMSHIDAFVNEGEEIGWSHFIGFYGNPDAAKRYESWTLLKSLRGVSQLPWMAIGDFNELVGVSEKEGGGCRPASQIARFSETIDWCGFQDVDFVGPKFTWLYQKNDGT